MERHEHLGIDRRRRADVDEPAAHAELVAGGLEVDPAQQPAPPAARRAATRSGSVSPITAADPVDDPRLLPRHVGQRRPGELVVVHADVVITATWASTTFVASQRPSSPTSITATSTATSANQRNAAAVHASKYVGRTPVSPSRSATAAICSASSSSSMGSALRVNRSLIRSRCGLVYVPTVRPWATSSRVTICAVDPLPLVPVMWITG